MLLLATEIARRRNMSRRRKRRRNASGSARIEWRVGGLGFVPPPNLSVQEQLDRYLRNAIPDFRNFSVGILPHLQNGDVFPSLTSVRHPVGDVAHDKSTVGAASWSRPAARRHAQPRLVQGLQRESLQMRLVAFLPTASRGAAAITIVYRLYGERGFPSPALQGHSPKALSYRNFQCRHRDAMPD
jgi:hypothetical protein